MTGGWVHIVTNRPNGTLYTGVTNDLAQRAREHRAGVVEGFTKRYGLKRLVFAERHDDIRTAIQRETLAARKGALDPGAKPGLAGSLRAPRLTCPVICPAPCRAPWITGTSQVMTW
jgi:predicted GIY-YIG superfamily endonuclease